MLAIPEEERANAATPIPKNPVSRSRRVAGLENIGCCAEGAIRSEDFARLLAERKPIRMVPDPPYAIELDSEWRDCAGLNGRGPAEPCYVQDQGLTMP